MKTAGFILANRAILVCVAIVMLVGCASPEATPEPSPQATEPPPQEAPPPPQDEPPPPAGSPCGDGVCDEVENPQNCPADCAEGGAQPAPSTGAPDYEPPINIFMVMHIDPSSMAGADTFQPSSGDYQTVYDEIEWLMDEAARHNMHMTFLFNGWYPQWALEQEGDLSQFQELVAEGHAIGSHAHRIIYDPAQQVWVSEVDVLDRYGRPNYDSALTENCWADADRYMDAVVAEIGATGQNQIMCAYPFMCSDEGLMMSEFGFSIASGDRSEKGLAYFGHLVWNPWRAAANDEPGYELEGDLSATFISLDHLAQIGMPSAHGTDVTVPQLQRQFLMLYAEWLARERTGAEDRVWVFGFAHHPNYGDDFNAAIVEFLDWLDANFIGQTSPHGNVIAQYASISEVGEEFVAWEAEHPGVMSFSYVRDDPYPYTYAVMPTLLENAAFDAELDLGPDVQAYRFTRDGAVIYMLWSDTGEQTIDFSGELAGQVQVTDHTGAESLQDASALHLTADPLFVQP